MRKPGVVTDYVLSTFDFGEWEKIMKDAFPVIPELIKQIWGFQALNSSLNPIRL